MSQGALQQLARENRKIEQAIASMVQSTPKDSFCCGMMDHLIQMHQSFADTLGEGLNDPDSPDQGTGPATEATPRTANAAMRLCRQLQWRLVKQYRQALRQGGTFSPAARQKLEIQFRRLQQMVSGFEYNASLARSRTQTGSA